jgi:ADP-ribose pyrophosphatase
VPTNVIERAPEKLLGRGKFLELIDEGGWEYVRRHAASGVVLIVATTEGRELVLVEQNRVPVHRRTIELPAGLVGDLPGQAAESLELAAARELEEETGFVASTWQQLVEGPSAVGASTEVVTFFRATGLQRVGKGGGDNTEDITVHVVPLDDVRLFIANKIAAGLLIDPKVYAALYFILTERRP